jgi:hypothetical protein
LKRGGTFGSFRLFAYFLTILPPSHSGSHQSRDLSFQNKRTQNTKPTKTKKCNKEGK